jgi:serine/threonine protein kinase
LPSPSAACLFRVVVSGIPADLRAALAGRYDLTSVLGRGGMAVVYLARDLRHARDVAIKVLRADLAATLGAERFLKEIEIAARLVHPHILPLHDSGQVDGFLYYVMPYLEGGSLRAALLRDGTLPLDRALAVTSAVGDALGYAHRMGVVHRDVKPENILFSQGHPVVADFGIAKAVTSAGGAALTRTGFPLGTPGYMSPEQAAGLSELDATTDVFALAVVTYEMLIGEVPGRWPTDAAVGAGRFLQAPPAHRRQLDALGPVVEAALVRAMAIRSDQRTATPTALLDDLTAGAPGPRRYSESEVQAIVRRASEIEATQPTADASMTIGAVQEIAREVGIPTEAVREAALELAPRTPAPRPLWEPGLPAMPPGANVRRPWLGAPNAVWLERVVEAELPEEAFWAAVGRIRDRLRIVGLVGQVGRMLTWSSATPDGRSIEIALAVGGGRTRLVVQEKHTNLLGATLGGIGAGIGGGGLAFIIAITARAMHAPELAPLAGVLWLATALVAARAAYTISARERERQLEGLADDLARLVEELGRRRLPGSGARTLPPA